MRFLANLICRRPKAVVVAWVIATLAVSTGTLELTSRNNYEGELPSSDPLVADQARFEAAFGDAQTMLVAVESPDLVSVESLAKLRQITKALGEIPGVGDGAVTGLATLDVSPGRSLLDLIDTMPDREHRRAALESRPGLSRFLSPDGNTTLISVDVSRRAEQADVASAVGTLTETFEGPESIYVIGDHTVAQAIDEGIEADLALLLPVALLLIFIAMRVCFGRARDALLTLSVTVGSIVWVLGLMGHLGVPLNVVTSTLPILLVAVSSSYGIHVLRYAASQEGKMEDRIAGLVESLGRPVLLTGLTSALGTLSLLLFDVHSIREFGLFASLGIATATAGSLVLLPAALALLPAGRSRNANRRGVHRLLSRIGAGAVRHRAAVLLGGAATVLICAEGVSRLEVGLDPVAMFPPDHPVRTATDVLTERFAGCRYFDVMVDAGRPGGALSPASIDAITAFHAVASKTPGVTSVTSAADLTASVPPAYLAEALSGAGLVDAAGRFSRLTVMLAATDQADQAALHERLRRLADRAFADGYTVSFGGPVLRWIAQNRYVSIGKVVSVLAASACVIAVCSIAFRSLRVGLLCATPLLVSTVATFGLMGWAGIRLNMATAITTSIGLGIGVDFGIHFLSRLRRELSRGSVEAAVGVTMATTGRAIVYDVGSNVIGFGVLMFSLFGPVRDFGWLISLTMLTSAAGALILLPAAAPWLVTSGAGEKHADNSYPLLETA